MIWANRYLLGSMFLTYFALLLLFRGEVLTDPPYGDQWEATWNEARYLARTDFDYYRLRYEEKNWMEGGSVRSYMISVIPTLYALLSRLTATPERAFIVAHLVMFAASSLTAAFVVACLADRIGRVAAILAGLAVLTTPLFLVQAEMIGMENLMALPGVVALYLASRGRYFWTAVACLAAFSLKASGGVFTLACLSFFLVGWVTWPWRDRAVLGRGPWIGVLALGAVLGIEYGASRWADDPAIFLEDFRWPLMLMPPRVFAWCPDVSLLWLGALAVAVVSGWRWGAARWTHSRGRTPFDGFFDRMARLVNRLYREEPLALVSFLFLAGLSVALARYVVFFRYLAPGIPVVYLLYGHCLATKVPRAWWAGGLSAIVLWNVANTNGARYAPIKELGQDEFAMWTWWHERSCSINERSGEYRTDLDGIRRTAAWLEEHAGDRPVFAELTYWFPLIEPAFGYVKRPIAKAVKVVDFAPTLEALRDALLAAKEDPGKGSPLVVWSGKGRTPLPEPGEEMEILFRDHHPAEPTIVYRFLLDRVPSDRKTLEEWLLDRTWGEKWRAQRALERDSFLAHTGRHERAVREINEALPTITFVDRLGMRKSLEECLAAHLHRIDENQGEDLLWHSTDPPTLGVDYLGTTPPVLTFSLHQSRRSRFFGPTVSLSKGAEYTLQLTMSGEGEMIVSAHLVTDDVERAMLEQGEPVLTNWGDQKHLVLTWKYRVDKDIPLARIMLNVAGGPGKLSWSNLDFARVK